MNKKDIRLSMIKQRKSLSREDVSSKSNLIINKLLSTPEFKKSETIMVYLSFQNEVDTYDLIRYCFNNDIRVVAPYNILDSKEIIPYEITNLSSHLEKSSLGVLEPNINLTNKVNIDMIDLIIVPGVAFDNKKNRLGFGAGYYDRFLAKRTKHIPAVALCYDFQIIPMVPTNKYDIPLDTVITEKRVIK